MEGVFQLGVFWGLLCCGVCAEVSEPKSPKPLTVLVPKDTPTPETGAD